MLSRETVGMAVHNGRRAALTSLRMSKHHGAGNDFLVVLDMDDELSLSASLVTALCDRRCGLGADGVLRVGPGVASDLSMELRNADGGVAEMSGNGIRCVAQAAVDAGVVEAPTFTVATAAGVRTVEYRSVAPGIGWASVDMGLATLGVHEVSLVGQGPARRVERRQPAPGGAPRGPRRARRGIARTRVSPPSVPGGAQRRVRGHRRPEASW